VALRGGELPLAGHDLAVAGEPTVAWIPAASSQSDVTALRIFFDPDTAAIAGQFSTGPERSGCTCPAE
jgi:hypothetical protein